MLLVAVVFYIASGDDTTPASLGTTEVTLDCAWTTGDGIGEGGSEEYLGDTPTRKDCVNKVLREATGANGATYSQTTGACTDERGCMRCYAEYGLTATNGNSDWQTCTLAGAISFNPVPSDWTVEGCDCSRRWPGRHRGGDPNRGPRHGPLCRGGEADVPDGKRRHW